MKLKFLTITREAGKNFFLRHPILIVLIPVLGFSTILLGRNWIPQHDTLSVIFSYHYFLSSLAFTGSVPLWNPYLDWGNEIPLHLMAALHAPAMALSALTWFSSHWNAVRLFFVSQVLSEILLLAGTYALGRRLFRSVVPTLFVSIAVVGAATWVEQVHLNYLLYANLPLALAFLLKGCQESRFWPILLGFTVVIFTGTMGNPTYFVIPQTFVCALFLLCWIWQYDPDIRKSIASWGGPEYAMLGLLGVAVAIPASVLLSIQWPLVVREGRDLSGITSIGSFLSNADRDFIAFRDLLTGLDAANDCRTYAGLITIPLLVRGLVFGPTRRQAPFLVVTVFLFLLALGKQSFLAPLVGLVPGLRSFRYLEYLASIIRILLIFLAGFGLESHLADARNGNRAAFRRSHVTLLVLTAAALVIGFSCRDQYDLSPRKLSILVVCTYAVYALILSTALVQGPRFANLTAGLLLCCLTIDVYGYRYRIDHAYLSPVSDEVYDLFRLRPLAYLEKRTENYFDNDTFSLMASDLFNMGELKRSDARAAFEACLNYGKECSSREASFLDYKGRKIGDIDNWILPFLGIDPCMPVFRTTFANRSLAGLYGEYGLNVDFFLRLKRTDYRYFTRSFKEIIGCESEKLTVYDTLTILPSILQEKELLGRKVFPPGLYATAEAVKSLPEINRHGRALASPAAPLVFSTDEKVGSGTPLSAKVEVTRFGTDHLQVAVRTREGGPSAWLYYADGWAPNWKAFINGEETPIVNVNLGFKAVPIPSGSAVVDFKYISEVSQLAFRGAFLLDFAYLILALGLLVVADSETWRGRGYVLPPRSGMPHHK